MKVIATAKTIAARTRFFLGKVSLAAMGDPPVVFPDDNLSRGFRSDTPTGGWGRGGWETPPILNRMKSIGAPGAVGLALAAIWMSGCGESSAARQRRTDARKPVTTTAARAPVQLHSVAAKIDVSSDKIIAEGKLHIASGAPSDAEIRREIREAKKAGIILPSGESAASFEAGSRYTSTALIETPVTSWNPRSKPIATWIVPILEWAATHGWGGAVTSGYRTYYEQLQLNAAGAFSAPAGLSNHETSAYPGGAVDVTAPGQLIEVLRGYRGRLKLVGGVLGPVDPEHFSATGD